MDPLAELPADTARWADAVASLSDAKKYEVGAWLVREWIEGRLEPRLLRDPRDDAALTKLRGELAAVIAALGGRDALELEWGGLNVDDVEARRWCWIEPWILLSQDEDIFLMSDHLVVPLLEEVRSGCTKRRYVIAIVAHHVRDQAHASLREGPNAVRQRIGELSRFGTPARAAGADELVAYLERLESYARPQKVPRQDALARVSDLWRCHAPPTVEIEGRGSEWRAKVSTAPGREEWIVIDAKTGAMRIEAPWQERAKSKGRHRAR